MQSEKTIRLRKPVNFADQDYQTIDLREPTAGELEKASSAATNLGIVITLISLVAGVPRRVVEAMSQRDLKEAGDFLETFSADDPTTGETPSPS